MQGQETGQEYKDRKQERNTRTGSRAEIQGQESRQEYVDRKQGRNL